MAAIGKILRKGNSVHQTAQYERLAQDPSDNEEEDDVLFKREALAKQNGHPQGTQNGVAGETIEMVNAEKTAVNSESPTAEELNLVKFKVTKRVTSLWRTRVSCFVLLLVLVLLLGLTLAFILPYFRNVKKLVVHHIRTKGWNKTIEDFGTESCIRLYDLDGDNLEDVIVGFQQSFALKSYKTVDEMKATCKSEGLDFPCEGEVIALRGTDGFVLWKAKLQSGVTDINCEDIDVNKDGQKDCIVSGKHGTFVAINSKSGAVLWNVETKYINIDWNVHQPLRLPDWDDDGVAELLVAHGGEYKYGPEQTFTKEDLLEKWQEQQKQTDDTSAEKAKKEEGGRLFVVSGATGKVVGRYMDIPRNREIHVSPVLHTTFDRSRYILFGSGGIGDTRSDGSLYIMAVPDLYRYVMNSTTQNVPGAGPGAYKALDNLPINSAKVSLVYKSELKGIMAPPVCVDVTKDGVKDVLLNAFDGNITMFNGENLTVIWQAKFPGFESYSVPAPAHFNDDDTVDFMVHLNYGRWPDYQYSLTVILDGKTGTKLWSLNSTLGEHSSDLVLRTKDKNRDAFVFRVQGISAKGEKKATEKDSAENKQRKRRATQYNQQYNQQYPPYRYGVGRKTYQPPNVRGQFQPEQQQPRYQTHAKVDNSNNDGSQFPANLQAGWNQQNAAPRAYSDSRYNHYGERYPYNPIDTGYENAGYEPNYDDPYAYDSDYIPDVKTLLEKYGAFADIEGTEDVFASKSECEEDLAKYTIDVFLMDRSNIWMPLKVLEVGAVRAFYNISLEDTPAKQKRDVSSKITPQKPDESGQYCSVMKPLEISTGAIADLDGDGGLDLVASVNFMGQLTDESGFHLKNIAEARIIKVNLMDVMKEKRMMPVNVTLSGGMKGVQSAAVSILNVEFLPLRQQPWISYRGRFGDSVYGSRH